MYCVYELLRPDGSVFYVGLTSGIKRRYADHLRTAVRGEQTHKARVIRKIIAAGGSVGIAVVRDGLTLEQANALEVERIAQYGRASLANATDGGDGTKGLVYTDAMRANIGAARRGKKHTEDARARIGASQVGRVISEETRARMSAARRGKPVSERHAAHLRQIADNCRGKKRGPMPEEVKAKIRAANVGREPWNKGKPGIPDDVRAKLRAAKLGKKRGPASEETRAKMRASHQARKRVSSEGTTDETGRI